MKYRPVSIWVLQKFHLSLHSPVPRPYARGGAIHIFTKTIKNDCALIYWLGENLFIEINQIPDLPLSLKGGIDKIDGYLFLTEYGLKTSA